VTSARPPPGSRSRVMRSGPRGKKTWDIIQDQKKIKKEKNTSEDEAEVKIRIGERTSTEAERENSG